MRRATITFVILSLLTLSSYGLVQAKTPIKALISGVPRYYQADMRVGGSCWFPSGCGPVAGAAICAWWDKRGFPNLIDDTELEPDGLPQEAIEDLGAVGYMNRDTSCAASWVLPGKFAEGLEEYMNDHLGPRGAVARFEVIRYRITDSGYEIPETGQTGTHDELFAIVRNEIWSGRPMVYLFRWDGQQNADGTFKACDHYAVVVGYDSSGGSRRLVIQANQSNDADTVVSGYENVYIDSSRYLRLGDHTRGSAAARYHLYAIRPVPADSVEIGLGAAPLLLDSAMVDNVAYHHGSDDGVGTAWFEPKLEQTDVLGEDLWRDHDDWGKTDELILQDGICFVAGWRSDEATAGGTDGDAEPDFEPVYVRAEVDSVSETKVKVTLFVELRNLRQPHAPYHGEVDIHWELATGGRSAAGSQGGTSQTIVKPLFPDSSTETVTYSGESTLYLEHSWLVDRDDWEGSAAFSRPLSFTIQADPDGEIAEADESNNLCKVEIGSWSAEAGFTAAGSRALEIQLSSQVKDRLGSLRLRGWGARSVDPTAFGDRSFIAIDVPRQDLAEFASLLVDADQGDLFVVFIPQFGAVVVDVVH